MKRLWALSLALSACAAPATHVEIGAGPKAVIAAQLNQGDPVGVRASWRDVILEERLKAVSSLALHNNRDLRIATLNLDKARQGLSLAHAGFLPSLNTNLTETKSLSPASVTTSGSAVSSDIYAANLSLNAYEIDLFGRVRAQGQAAHETQLSSAATLRAVRLNLINAVGQAWLSLAADQALLRLGRATQDTRDATLDIALKRQSIGVASEIEVNSLRQLAEQAHSDVALAQTRVEADHAALVLLIGAQPESWLLPDDWGDKAVATPNTGTQSDILLGRADVMAAEHALKAQKANIDVARAAFFPRITLIGSSGSASRDLNGLFDPGTHAYSFVPQISLPIFAGGANLANYRIARDNRDIALAAYEKTLQSAFAEVETDLAVQAHLNARLQSQARILSAAQANADLEKARFESGADSYLTRLETERSLYAAQQAMITLTLLKASTDLNLYKALGVDTD